MDRIEDYLRIDEDSDGSIVRMYDATGDGADVELTIKFKIQKAYESNLPERIVKPADVRRNKIRAHLSPSR